MKKRELLAFIFHPLSGMSVFHFRRSRLERRPTAAGRSQPSAYQNRYLPASEATTVGLSFSMPVGGDPGPERFETRGVRLSCTGETGGLRIIAIQSM